MRLVRLLDRWFALHLSVGLVAIALLRPVLGYSSGYFAGSAVALLVAVALSTLEPELESGPLWRLGLLTVAVYVLLRAGEWVVGVGPLPEPVRALAAIVVSLALVWRWSERAPERVARDGR